VHKVFGGSKKMIAFLAVGLIFFGSWVYSDILFRVITLRELLMDDLPRLVTCVLALSCVGAMGLLYAVSAFVLTFLVLGCRIYKKRAGSKEKKYRGWLPPKAPSDHQ
jgi:hypothetical protein